MPLLQPQQRNLTANVLLAFALLVAAMASLGLGTVAIAPGAVFSALAGSGDAIHQFVVTELRLPRLLCLQCLGEVVRS